MAKIQTKRKGFFSRLSKSQRTSLIVLLVLAVALPLVVIVAQLRTRTSPYARMAPETTGPVCTGKVRSLSFTPCQGKKDRFSRVTFMCDSDKTTQTINTSCTTKGQLTSKATSVCITRCRTIKKVTPTVSPTSCTAKVSAVVAYNACSTDTAKFSSIVFTCSNNITTKHTVTSLCTTKDSLLQQANIYCQKTCSAAVTPTAKPTTDCAYSNTVCAAVYSPVCGTNGKTYSNSCEAKRNCISVQCNGSCPCAKVTATPMIERPRPTSTYITPTPMIQRPAY